MLNDTTIEKLKTTLRGELIQRSDERYDEARKLWNGMFDRRPALIVRCAGTADVVSAVNFARENRLQVAVRGGGHSFPGHSVCDGGLVIDLSPMRSIRVDPAARTARAQPGAKWIDFDHETQAFGLATTGGTAETEGRARRHEPGATAREDGHEVADAPGEDTRRATAWAWSSNEPVHDQDATKACPERDLAFSG